MQESGTGEIIHPTTPQDWESMRREIAQGPLGLLCISKRFFSSGITKEICGHSPLGPVGLMLSENLLPICCLSMDQNDANKFKLIPTQSDTNSSDRENDWACNWQINLCLRLFREALSFHRAPK